MLVGHVKSQSGHACSNVLGDFGVSSWHFVRADTFAEDPSLVSSTGIWPFTTNCLWFPFQGILNPSSGFGVQGHLHSHMQMSVYTVFKKKKKKKEAMLKWFPDPRCLMDFVY